MKHSMKHCLILFLILVMSHVQTHASDDNIQFLTHSAKDAVTEDEDGSLRAIPGKGRRAIDVAVISRLLSDTGLPNNIMDYPFKRALLMVQTQENYALFNVLRTPEREATVQWVGPLNRYSSYFYEAKHSPTNIKSLEDARAVKSICVLSGNAHHNELLRLAFDNLVLGATYGQCADLLLKGRVSLMPAGENPRFIYREGFKDKIQRTPVQLTSQDGYLALSLNIPEQTITRLQESLDSLKESPDYQAIRDKYSEQAP